VCCRKRLKIITEFFLSCLTRTPPCLTRMILAGCLLTVSLSTEFFLSCLTRTPPVSRSPAVPPRSRPRQPLPSLYPACSSLLRAAAAHPHLDSSILPRSRRAHCSDVLWIREPQHRPIWLLPSWQRMRLRRRWRLQRRKVQLQRRWCSDAQPRRRLAQPAAAAMWLQDPAMQKDCPHQQKSQSGILLLPESRI
jgi:hypothetical protein